MDKLNIILGVHSHQPVGNFDFVFREAYHNAYLPFLEVIREHPSIPWAFHFSGPLFDWFEHHHPEFLDWIRQLTAKGQAELLTGGYYEPILPILPDADKLGQINELSSYIQARFDFRAKGAWVAERVWEPHLAKPLAEAGVEFIILDDSHFLFAGLNESELSGYFQTEEQGFFVKIFPISKRLRYLIPFADTSKVMEHLHALYRERGPSLVVIVDDGEKFGIWPGTHDWVYKKGWLHQFLKSMEENRDWLEAVTFSNYLANHEPLGRVYIPSGSYEEMMEWALPFEARLDFEAALEKIKTIEQSERLLPFFKGGFWRNFLVKYQESQHLYKRMLGISKRIQRMEAEGEGRSDSDRKKMAEAREELYRSQCNDVYWHGIFGGLYLPHLRHAAYQHLIRSESIIDGIGRVNGSWIDWRQTESDESGSNDFLVTTSTYALCFDLDRGGSLVELDYRPKAMNLINTLARRPEAYHMKRGRERNGNPSSNQGIKTIHEMELGVIQPESEEPLAYDWYQRSSLLDHFLGPESEINQFSRCQYKEWGDFINQRYRLNIKKAKGGTLFFLSREGHIWFPNSPAAIRVEKRILLGEDSKDIRIQYAIENRHTSEIHTIFGIEFNFNFLAGSSPDRYYLINGGKPKNCYLESLGESEDVNEIGLVDEPNTLHLILRVTNPATLWRFPIFTVSQSEKGLEKIFQGSSLLPHWKLTLSPSQKWKTTIFIHVAG